jgi:hypothetical protein
MEFGSPSSGNGGITRGLFVHNDGSNNAATDVLDKMKPASRRPRQRNKRVLWLQAVLILPFP